MPVNLSDALVRRLPVPSLTRDSVVRGLAIRVSSPTARTFVLCHGRRRVKLGAFGTINTAQARALARERLATASGLRPSALLTTETIASLLTRYEREYLPLKSGRSRIEDERLIARVIVPTLGEREAHTLTRQDMQGWHARITRERGPIRANRALAVMSKVLNLYTDKNVCRGVKRNRENRRERYFTDAELERINAALDSFADQEAADVVRFIALTGARPCEVMRTTREDFREGRWHRRAAHMKARRASTVPLSDDAWKVAMRLKHGHRSLLAVWRHVRKFAKIDAPLYCLRHTFASRLVQRGVSIVVVGRLMAHANVTTTLRYSHADDAQLLEAVQKLSSRS